MTPCLTAELTRACGTAPAVRLRVSSCEQLGTDFYRGIGAIVPVSGLDADA